MAQTFQYKVRDKAGNMVTGTLVADSELLVLQRLREMGYTPLEVGKEKKGLNLEINIRKAEGQAEGPLGLLAAVRDDDQLGPADPAGPRRSSPSRPRTSCWARRSTTCRMDVEQGASLSGAMAKHPKVFNDLYISMVKSGEMGGSLDTTLLKLAAMLEREVHLRGKIKSAMTYPVAVVGLVLLIMSAMLLFVVPQFEGIYGQLGGTLPLPTRVAARDVGRVQEVLVHRASAAASWRGSSSAGTRRPRTGRMQIDRLKLRVPVFGPLFHKTALVAVLQHARDAAVGRRADPAGLRHRRPTR